MTKDSKAEATTAMPADTAATPAQVEVGNDATSRPSRRSRKAGRRPRVGRIHRLHRGEGGRRSVTGPTVPVNDAATTNAAPTVAPNEVSANTTTDASRASLTEQFQKWNEKSVEAAIEKSRLIKRAQKELSNKEWRAWVREDLRLSPYTAKLYEHISNNSILCDQQYWKQLPSEPRSLYELSLIRDKTKLLEYIAQGDVHQGLTRAQATKLKNTALDKPTRKKRNDDDDDDIFPPIEDHIERCLNALRVIRPDKALTDYMRDHPPPNEIPSADEIEDALRYVINEIQKKRGAR
jgi:hypothetical protein